MVSEISKHEFSFYEMNGKKNLSTFTTFHRIYLCNRQIRMLPDIKLVISIGTPQTATLIYFVYFLFLTAGITDFSWKINVFCIKKAIIYKTVHSTFTHHNRIRMVNTNMMQGLLLFQKRGNNAVQVDDFIFCQENT